MCKIFLKNRIKMINIPHVFLISLAIILPSVLVNGSNVDKIEKRFDLDSYIDALRKTHEEDGLNRECN